MSVLSPFQVRGDSHSLRLGGSKLVGKFLDQFGAVDQHQAAALRADAAGSTFADTLRRTGNQYDLPSEVAGRDELRPPRSCGVSHRPPNGLLAPVGVGDQHRSGSLTVTGFDGLDDVHVVLRDQWMAPGRVLQHLVHPTLEAQCVVGLAQMRVAGQVEQIIVERPVALDPLGSVDESVAVDQGQCRFGEHSVPGQLLVAQPAQDEIQCAKFEGLAGPNSASVPLICPIWYPSSATVVTSGTAGAATSGDKASAGKTC